MKIAKNLLTTSDTSVGPEDKRRDRMKRALEIISEFNVLKVEDLLDLIPQNAEVNEMKEHLCKCLDDYDDKIKGL